MTIEFRKHSDDGFDEAEKCIIDSGERDKSLEKIGGPVDDQTREEKRERPRIDLRWSLKYSVEGHKRQPVS